MNPLMSRLIHHLDENGRVERITYLPGTSIDEHQACVRLTVELLDRCVCLLHCLNTFDVPPQLKDPQLLQGYQQALVEIKATDELQALRDAMGNLRPSLALDARFANGGLTIPRTEVVPEFLLHKTRYRPRTA
jgi:hypothetical protein